MIAKKLSESSRAASQEDARTMAETIANSPLVKTAVFGEDANWGRILAAVGRANVEDIATDKVSLTINDTRILENGEPLAVSNDLAGHDDVMIVVVMAGMMQHTMIAVCMAWIASWAALPVISPFTI